MARRRTAGRTALALACIVLLCFSFPCTADDASTHSSVDAAPASHAAPTLPNAASPSEEDTTADLPQQQANEQQSRIDELLRRAEHMRFGIADVKGSKKLPRPDVHSFPSQASLAHSVAADRLIDWEGAVQLYTQAADLGSHAAMNELGEMHLYSSAAAPNHTAAAAWFARAADEGNPEAQHQLAILHWLGLNNAAQRDEASAMLYDYFSALGDNPLAKMALGYRHLAGLSAPLSCDAAAAYYQQVSEAVVAQVTAAPIQLVVERARLADEQARSVAPEEDEDVIHYYQHSAENGDVAAQVALGHLHFYGVRGFEQNPERAARYFKAAAAAGDASALASLGQMHVQGLGVAQNNETAFELLSEAAGKGNAAAQAGLGYLYLQGQGVARDLAAALAWFKKGAAAGNAEAAFHLGAMYFAGLGVDKKYATAQGYFSMAGHQGHKHALYNLAQMHLYGLGSIKSCALGVKLHKTVAERGSWATVLNEAHRHFLKAHYDTAWLLYARAAEEGHEVAQANSAWMLDQGYGGAMLDELDAKQWAAEAAAAEAKNNDAAAAAEESTSDSSEVTPASPPLARVSRRHQLAHRHWTLASQQGNVDALRMLGDYAYSGLVTGGVADYPLALRLYTQAAENNNAQAMFNLAQMYEQGLGVPDAQPDFHLAKRYLDNCLAAEPDAVAPVKLAMTKLYIKHYWHEYFATPSADEDDDSSQQQQQQEDATDAKSGDAKSSGAKGSEDAGSSGKAASKRARGGRLSTKGGWEWVPGVLVVKEWYAQLQQASGFVDLFLSLEDVLLALLCGALAIVVYWRSQRLAVHA